MQSQIIARQWSSETISTTGRVRKAKRVGETILKGSKDYAKLGKCGKSKTEHS